MDEASIKHLAIVLSNVTDASVDWTEVAKIRGISRKDNAATAFKNMIKKYGLEYANNKFTLTDPDAAATAASETKTKSKPTTPRKRKPKADEDGASEDKNGSVSPKKKVKAKKEVEEEEHEIKEDVAEGEAD